MTNSAQATIVMSIAPKWAEMILNGVKKVELRRSRFACSPCKILIYATAPASSIIARCDASEALSGSTEFLWSSIGQASGCTRNEFFDYLRNAKQPTAIRLSNVSPMRPLTLQFLMREFAWHPPVAWHRLAANSPILSWIETQ